MLCRRVEYSRPMSCSYRRRRIRDITRSNSEATVMVYLSKSSLLLLLHIYTWANISFYSVKYDLVPNLPRSRPSQRSCRRVSLIFDDFAHCCYWMCSKNFHSLIWSVSSRASTLPAWSSLYEINKIFNTCMVLKKFPTGFDESTYLLCFVQALRWSEPMYGNNVKKQLMWIFVCSASFGM